MLDIHIIRSYTNYGDQEGIIMKHINPPAIKPLSGKTVLITGSARRIGRSLALTVAHAGGNVVIHHGHSPKLAQQTLTEINALGAVAHLVAADLSDPNQAAELFYRACAYGPIFALVNNAAIFEPVSFLTTTIDDWQRHININLTAPMLISQAMARETPEKEKARIVNILDWRALRPGVEHFPYTISKSALVAMTQSLAISLAPRITVNGLALGAVLPPVDQPKQPDLIKNVPVKRWATLEEVGEAMLFLLTGPEYITGEIIHIDGGRHLI
jgi:NAD(P)-dependent dehydrogenase (short-subunit alcohol dehydrogenase family)